MGVLNKELAVARLNASEFMNSLVLVHKDGTTITVPAEAKDNKLKSQLVVAGLREFLEEQVNFYRKDGKRIPSGIIKDLVTAHDKVEEMGRYAYADLLTVNEGGMAPGHSPAAMVKAMAEGMTAATLKSQSEDRMKRITELGKPKKSAKETVIEAEHKSAIIDVE